MLELFERARESGFDSAAVAALGLDPRAVDPVARLSRQLVRLMRLPRKPRQNAADVDEAIGLAALVAFPDRVAGRRRAGSPELLLSAGGAARLSSAGVVHNAMLLVAVDVEERSGARGSRDMESVVVRLASAVEPEWLAELFPERLRDERELVWNEPAGRVDEARRTRYDSLTVAEAVRPASPSAAAGRLLADAAIRRELRDFADGGALAGLRARVEILSRAFPERGVPLFGTEEIHSAVENACSGMRSLSQLREMSLGRILLGGMRPDSRRLLEEEAPERITLRGGRKVKVHYEPDRPPWVESRLQDFFGMSSTPTICGGRIGLTVRLLAPNMRPVQVTQDLAGFWKEHYPGLRRQLRRRYPRHAWPEDGASGKR